MITRHHVALSIICTLILCSALVPADPVLIAMICAGACTGAMLPDIQMKKPQDFQVRTIAWIITRLSRFVITPLICRAYLAFSGQIVHADDKRLTHSVPGVLSLWIGIAGFTIVPVIIFTGRIGGYLSAGFLAGVMLGMTLHLLEDLCTKKGITPLFPFSSVRISGSIRPCDTADRRIAQFHFYDCSVACIILGFDLLGTWHGVAPIPVSIFALGSCLGMMIWSSDVLVSREDVRNEQDYLIHSGHLNPENPDRSLS